MSKSAKIWLGILVAAVVIGGATWYWSANPAGGPSATAPTTDQTGATAQQQNSPAIAANGTSDAQLNSDLSNTDSQMNSFNSDSANIDQGLNDQPVQQQSF